MRVTLAIVLGGSAYFLFRPGEPSYDGESLSVWLAAFTGSDLSARVRAHRAIREMGTNTLPHLTRRVFHRDSELKLKWMQFTYRQSWIDLDFLTTNERRAQVAGALKALGSDARPMVPLLTARISNLDTWSRSAAAWALGVLGQDLAETLPALDTALSDAEWQVRLAGVIAAGEIGPEAGSLVPSLIPMLGDERWVVRVNTVKTLGLIGSPARAAIPELKRVVLTEEHRIRRHAIRALSRIEIRADESSSTF